eukprot:g38430.t1
MGCFQSKEHDWPGACHRWLSRSQSLFEIDLTSPSEPPFPLDASELQKGLCHIQAALIKGRVRRLCLKLVIQPAGFRLSSQTSCRNDDGEIFISYSNHIQQRVHNGHVVAHWLPPMLAWMASDSKHCMIESLRFPAYSLTRLDELNKDLVPALRRIQDLCVDHANDTDWLCWLLESLVQGLEQNQLALQRLAITYDLDELSTKVYQHVEKLLSLDMLESFKMSKNKQWRSHPVKVDAESGLDDTGALHIARGLLRVRKLTYLDLSNNHISDKGVQALYSVLHANSRLQLQELCLGCNIIGAAAVPLLKELTNVERHRTKLRFLDLSSNWLDQPVFERLMSVVQKSPAIEQLDVRFHDLNIDMHRLSRGARLRTLRRRQLTHKQIIKHYLRHFPVATPKEVAANCPQPVLQLDILLCSVREIGNFSYLTAVPAWLFCGACCLLEGPFHGKQLSLTSVLEGNVIKPGACGSFGASLAVFFGCFFLLFSFLFPFSIMSDSSSSGIVPINVRAQISMLVFLVPLIGWMCFIFVAAWRDPHQQWTTVSNPSYEARLWPFPVLVRNQLKILLIFVDFFQLLSLEFSSEFDDQQEQVGAGFLDDFLKGFRLDFGQSFYKLTLYAVFLLVGVWWMIAVYVITSVVVKRAENATKLPLSWLLVPTLSNVLFIMIVTNLLNPLKCAYVDLASDTQVSYVEATCDTSAGQGPLDCGPELQLCWVGEHRWQVTGAMLSLVLYTISAPLVGTFFAEDHTGQCDIQFAPLFPLIERVLKLMMSTVFIFFGQTPSISTIMVMVVTSLLAALTFHMQPVQHIQWVNSLRLGTYVACVWCGLCVLLVRLLVLGAWMGNVLLLSGWALIALGTAVGIARAKRSQAAEKNGNEHELVPLRPESNEDNVRDQEESVQVESPTPTAPNASHAWHCSLCTYENHSADACAMCGHERDGPAELAAAHRADSLPDSPLCADVRLTGKSDAKGFTRRDRRGLVQVADGRHRFWRIFLHKR